MYKSICLVSLAVSILQCLVVYANLSDILIVGNKLLSTPCQEVKLSDIISHDATLFERVDHLHRALHEFRVTSGFGRAIAAPQLGYTLQFIAAHLNGRNYTIFNPSITFRSPELFTMWDDCLSFPDLMVSVKRHKKISVSFINEIGEVESWNDLDQATSELLQHEIDHLNGILAVDIASPLLDNDGNQLVESIVSRKAWLADRAHFESFVDYSIPTLTHPLSDVEIIPQEVDSKSEEL